LSEGQFEVSGATMFYIEGDDEVYLFLTCKCFNFFKSQNRQRNQKILDFFPIQAFLLEAPFFTRRQER